jgi:hypothetical protein
MLRLVDIAIDATLGLGLMFNEVCIPLAPTIVVH